ncbi:MAG TPA: Hsp20/alpha crystallin family protein [Tepidiformaceae bacterium]|nr:Hsp20/alpha crystallin family protein [Tepidiformaceae bacterium]
MAASLTRWDPFQELASMRNVLDRVFDQGIGRLPVRNGDELGAATLGLDVYETNDEYVVKAAVPGIDPKDVSIEVEDDVLTIKGETRQSEEVKEETYLRRELRWGSFSRALRLPPTVDAENAQATFEHGVLKLSLPKKAEAKSKTIKITPQGVIEGAKE